MRTFLLSETAKAANPGVPTVFEIRWRCAARRQGGHGGYSIHKTREEAEASAANCRGYQSVRVFQTREEFFDI